MAQEAWFVLLGAVFFMWLIVFTRRKKDHRKSFIFGILTVVAAAIIELWGISQELWNYTGEGTWPMLLWPTYFFSGMMALEVFEFITKKR